MKFRHIASSLTMGLAMGLLLLRTSAAQATALDLRGYTDGTGAITILNGGDTTDPYFAMQALLLAHDNGLDVSVPAEKFVNWLLPYQKPDGTFDRFCRGTDKNWVSCKTADADDSLLAIWMRLLEVMPAQMVKNPMWAKSHQISKNALNHLFQPSRGIYMVSPVYLHGLFMDNLEVWSLKAHLKTAKPGEADMLARAVYGTFWNPVNKRFLVSTQLEQQSQKPQFYPDHVAQIFPLLVDFPLLPQDARQYYQNWMRAYRADWLSQGEKDYPWGLLAVLALRQSDKPSARCWLREASRLRHSSRWAVTDEVAYQILASKGISSAGKETGCT